MLSLNLSDGALRIPGAGLTRPLSRCSEHRLWTCDLILHPLKALLPDGGMGQVGGEVSF